MANDAFLHPAICHIRDEEGCIKLHRVEITRKGMRGTVMTCKAEIVRYYDGETFIDCPFDGDDVQVPLDYFNFTRYGNCLIGKPLLQFKAECGMMDMPISIAEMVVIFYPV